MNGSEDLQTPDIPSNRDPHLIGRLLSVIEDEILPKTRGGVAQGNKIFGAAILRKADLSTVIADTNNETENPLWHGEVQALKTFYELPASERPATRDCLFLATHEPCSLCLSAITWAGFDNFTYFFSHMDSRDAFAIPHDLKILREVFRLEPGGYARENAFWKSQNLAALIAGSGQPDLIARAQALREAYAALSATYQDGKGGNDIPLR